MSSADIVIVVIVAWIVLLIVHELGHLVAARWVGYGVERATIGVGPTIYSARVGSSVVELGLAPVGGSVVPRVNDPMRWRSAVFYAGGPLASATAIGAILFLPQGPYRLAILVAAIFLTGITALPLGPGVDGWEFVAVIRGRRDHRLEANPVLGHLQDEGSELDADEIVKVLDFAVGEVELTKSGSIPPELLTLAGLRYLDRQRYQKAVEVLRRALRSDSPPELPVDVPLLLAQVCARIGDFDTAWRVAIDRLAHDGELSTDDQEQAHLTLFEVDRQLGRFDQAAVHLRAARAVGSADSAGWLDLCDGVLSQDQGLLERSASSFGLAIDGIRSERSLGLAETLLARTFLEQGRLLEAQRLLSSAHPRVAEDQPVSLGTWKMTEGVRRRLLGECDESMMALAEARALFTDADVIPLRARVALEAGRTELARGNPGRARQIYRHASEAFEGLGAYGWCEVIDQEIARVLPVEP